MNISYLKRRKIELSSKFSSSGSVWSRAKHKARRRRKMGTKPPYCHHSVRS
jgi:hypothetical protein